MVDAVLRARFLIDLQPEHIRTRVVTDHVQVELPFGDLAGIEISREDLLTRIIWPSQQATEWIYNQATAAHEHSLWVVSLDRQVIRGIVATANVLTGRDYETSAFERDMPHGGHPG